MKKKIILFAAAVAAMACIVTAVTLNSSANSNPVFEANIETLSNGEVSAGPLCAGGYGECIYPDGFSYPGTFNVS